MTSEPDPAKRTEEIEEATNRYLIHPISRAFVARFARWGVPPNAVSLLGAALGGGAAAAYYHYRAWPMALLGFLLMLGWHVMDGADGQLARLTGRTSALGQVLDGVCDHVAFLLVYVSLALATAPELGAWVWLAAAAAGLSHAVQASAYEFQRQSYDFWAHARRAAPEAANGRHNAASRPAAPAPLRRRLREERGLSRLFARLHLGYLRLQHRVAAVDGSLQDRLTAALKSSDDEARIRSAYRAVQRESVKRWSVLSSNYRTLAIFAACLAGTPVLFFWFEIVVLNAAFVLLVWMQIRRNQTLNARLSDLARPEALEPTPAEAQ